MTGNCPMMSDWPLVGRARELVAIGAAIGTSTATGKGGDSGVVLAGEAGVGRTRLARAVLTRARRAGRDTCWLAATRTCAAIPFGALLPLVAGDEPPGTDPMAVLHQAVRRAARHRPPLVVGVDDAHLLDEQSAWVIQQLALRGLVSVVATVRAGEPTPDAVTALWKDALAHRILVEPLTPGAMDELLTRSLGPQVEGVTRLAIVRTAAGRPRLLRDLLVEAYEDGALVCREGVWLWDRAADRTEGFGQPASTLWDEAVFGWTHCLGLVLAGRLHEARNLAEAGYSGAVDQGIREVAIGWAGCRGAIAKAQGQVATAQAVLREAVAALHGRGADQLARWLLADLGGAAALAGDAAGAGRWMRRADALRTEGPQGEVRRLVDPWIELDRAWVIAAGGNLERAARQARWAADLADDTKQYDAEAIALYDVARLGAPSSAMPRLADLAEAVHGPLVPALTRAADALVALDGSALDATAAALDDRGLALHAAETAAAAVRAHLTAGNQAAAVAARTRMTVLLDRCEGASTPLLTAQRGLGVSALSRREHEIALLAASGLSSKAIAERLSLSVRTVDNHLGRVYARLGVSGRAALAVLIGQRPGRT
ncbi:LuxR family transcriptional regulator [Streptomyces sp. MNP-20]|uniref:helix-turn-helix transcriptional regulator n=1 Tax=Streptomyces sp. MNP-20 TaxID=2721165 RepID=UPI001557AB3E|nr:LuxR family transcriptional regulator [Streptomyces sp. MNP-20]